MKRWGALHPVHLDKKELKTDLGHGNFIFVGSSCDMWAETIPHEWISDTLVHCHEYDNHYLFQSKNPARILNYNLPKNSVVCTTIETNRVYGSIMRNSPTPYNRAAAMSGTGYERFVTIEPVMDFDISNLVALIQICEPSQVNIGADSGGNRLPEPSKDKLLALIEELSKFTTIAQKQNLGRLLK